MKTHTHPFPKYWEGKKFSEEHKKKLSEAHKGRIFSDEWRKNMSLVKGRTDWIPGVSTEERYRFIHKQQWYKRQKSLKGKYSQKEWMELLENYKRTCPACGMGEPDVLLTPDHIIPISKGGLNYISNIQPLCLTCNLKKWTKTIKYENSFT